MNGGHASGPPGDRLRDTSNLRWASLLLWLPLSLVVGVFAAEQLGSLLGIWREYVGAIVLPILGLAGAYGIAPRGKLVAAAVFYAVGTGLAFHFFYPSAYPESDPRAYQPTYVPFYITLAVATATLALLALRSRFQRESKPRT